MKNTYTFRYAWGDIWHTTNRPFTLINIIAITVSVTTLILLLGGLKAFRNSSNERIGDLGLRIEVTAHEESKISDVQRNALTNLPNIKYNYWWKPTLFLFYNAQARLHDGIGGRTVDLNDPLLKNLRDVRTDEKVAFLSKSQIKDGVFDEMGIIVPFVMLKQLSYLPHSADLNQPQTWKHIPFPRALRVRIKEQGVSGTAMNVDLPIVGVVTGTSGRYLVTKECYEILGLQWKEEFMPFAKSRSGESLFSDSKASNTPPQLSSFTDTHASVYVNDRQYLLTSLHKIRSLGLRASSPLEFHLEDYEQQETFFIAAAGGICLALFLFTGVILFATFYALTLRKKKEIGILKACGASSWLVSKIFVLQALNIGFLAILGGVSVGLLAGMQLSAYIQKQMQTSAPFFSMPQQYIAIIFGGGLLFCLLVTFIPVRMAVKVDADTVIRAN